MALRLRAEDAADWTYRGEGAANLVLEYRGSSPAFVGKVLRVQKTRRTGGDRPAAANGGGAAAIAPDSVLSPHERMLWKDVEKLAESTSKEVAGQLFVLHVMTPLLGPQHVDPGMHVLVSKEFLLAVEKSVLDQRPSWRVNASKVNTSRDSALLMSDHSVFPHGSIKENLCIAVEIKPKCGFLPSSDFITKGNIIKTCVTRFRMHQALKLHQGEISRISEYEPLDLFSGSRDRISQAIMSLFACPQNNFRVFFNGSLVFGALGGGMDRTTLPSDEPYKRVEAFEDLLKSVIRANHGLRSASFLELVAEVIFRSGVMARLLEAQKLDVFDIEGAIHAYYNIVSQPCLVCENLGDSELLHKYSFLHSLTFGESLKIVKEYLIAATAKDCSLMISFEPRECGDMASEFGSIFLESTNQNFNYKAYFIDLDMKPLEKMVYYYELDKKIVGFYKKAGIVANSPCDGGTGTVDT